MKLKGFFVSCVEKPWTSKDGSKSGMNIKCRFQVAGERDTIELTTWHDKAWCIEHGITTGAAGEVNAHFGENDRGYYEQVIWGFKTQAQMEAEKAEKEKDESLSGAAANQQKAEEAIAAAKEAGENTDLPF